MNHSLVLSPVVAGMSRANAWPLDAQQWVRWVEQALELGVTSFDHADVYGSYAVETMFGEALALAPQLRSRIQIVTKCGVKRPATERPEHHIKSYDSSRAHVLASVDASLRALRTDHVDLLLLHRPDLLVEPDELADTFRHLLAAGKVLHFGVSNHGTSQLNLLRKRHPLATHQFEFSPLQMRALADGTLEQCVDLQFRPMVWAVLGGGRLLSGDDDQARRVRAVLQDLGRQHGNASVVAMACAWVQRHPSRPHAVIGSSRIETFRQAVAAQHIHLNHEDWYRVWQASLGYELP